MPARPRAGQAYLEEFSLGNAEDVSEMLSASYAFGAGGALDIQFTRWSLTDAEREVALLLLKGLSTKEIAAVRTGSERTVREHARSIYAKAGLTGRAALSAFFLENLLAPIDGLR